MTTTTTIPAFKRCVRYGDLDTTTARGRKITAPCFAFIRWDGKELAISGVEGPMLNGDAHGSCGQCLNNERVKLNEHGAALVAIWKRWHLNHMRAGSPRQTAWLDSNPGPRDYDSACKRLAFVGLNPDPEGHGPWAALGGDVPGPYSYGHRWLQEPIDMAVVETLLAMPDASAGCPTTWLRD